MSAQHCDLVAQYEYLDILDGVGPGEQHEPAQHSGKDEVRESKRHSAIMLIGQWMVVRLGALGRRWSGA